MPMSETNPTTLAGTSGFSYPEWRGAFYPSDLAPSAMLEYYASRLPTVEINATFYRMPKSEVVAAWAVATPESFRFAIKASRRITHLAKLRDVSDAVQYLVRVTAALGARLGAVLFQLPPFLRRDDALLADFLALLPQGFPAALEVRHRSWLDDGVYAALRQKNVALVAGDPEDDELETPLIATADFGYLRLRAKSYARPEIETWRERIQAQPWRRALVYFKHETLGPEYALALGGVIPRPGLARARQPPAAESFARRRRVSH